MRPVVGSGAVHAQTDVYAGRAVFLDWSDAGSEPHIRSGTVRHTAVMFCKNLDLFVIDPDRVREPNVSAHPIYFLHIPNGTMPEALQAELLFVFGLCQVGVQMHTVFTRQF